MEHNYFKEFERGPTKNIPVEFGKNPVSEEKFFKGRVFKGTIVSEEKFFKGRVYGRTHGQMDAGRTQGHENCSLAFGQWS